MPRDYQAEYRRRIASAERRGLSRSQARGHARAGETSSRPDTASSDKLEIALKSLRQGMSLTKAARAVSLAPESVRRFIREQGLAQREGRAWRVTDQRPRVVWMFTRGRERRVRVRGFEPSSEIAKHRAAVIRFRGTNSADELGPFVGRSVIDTQGRRHPFEVNQNALHRIAATGDDRYDQVYKIIK